MHLLAITPIHVDAEERARRQERYDRLAPPGVTVRLEDLGEGSEVPRALETADDVAASEEAVVAWFAAADVDSVDAFLPDCVLDPAVDHATPLARPVFGIGRLCAAFLAGFGGRVAAVARNEAIAHELDRKLASYGLAPVLPTAVLDLSVEDIADDAVWASAVRRRVDQLPVDQVINACSAVEVGEPDGGPLLVDPTRVALHLLGMRRALTGGEQGSHR